MAHFAELDPNNVVLRVTVVDNSVLLDENGHESEALGIQHLKHLGGRWVQTSYNKNFRQEYAGIGYIYNETYDVFVPPKPFPSWVLNATVFENKTTCQWEAPVAHPTDNKTYYWDEPSRSWIESTSS